MNGTEPRDYGRAALSPAVVIGAVVIIILFSVSAVVYIVALGREPEAIIGLLTAIAAPTIVAFLGLLRTEIVKRQTNGAMTAMHERMSTLEDKVPAAVNDPSVEMGNDGQQAI